MEAQKRKEAISGLMLGVTALVWGVAFIFQRTGMEHIGPYAFNFFRCLVCVIFLMLVSYISDMRFKRKNIKVGGFKDKVIFKGGILAGVVLFLAMSSQQVGMVSTTASKAGFITTMYIVIVPLLGVFYGRKVSPKIIVCVALAAVGLYLLSIKSGFTISRGDFFVFVSAIFYSLQIVVIDIFAPGVDSIKLSLVEFITAGILSLVAMLVLETVTMESVMLASTAILYTGLMSSGIGFTLQIVAQKNLQPTIASLLMSSESVVSLLAGIVLLGESLTSREFSGCFILVVAILLAQIDFPVKKIKKSH